MTMPMKPSVLIVAFLSLLPCRAGATTPTTVRGKLLSHDGEPLAGAYVSVTSAGQRERGVTDPDGGFALRIGGAGACWLWVAAPHHRTELAPLMVTEVSGIEVEVRMAAAAYVVPLDSVWVVGDFNGFEASAGAVAMERRAEGTFVARIDTDADTLAYQLAGVQIDGYALAGTQADRYVMDRSRPLHGGKAGNFVSVIDVRERPVEVVFDARLLPRTQAKMTIRFGEGAGPAAGVFVIHEASQARQSRFIAALDAHGDAGGDPAAFTYDTSNDRWELEERLEAESDVLVRSYLLTSYFTVPPADGDSLIARRVLDEVPADSPAWSLAWAGPANLFFSITRTAREPERAMAYAERAGETHPDPEVRADFLFSALGQARAAGDAERFERHYGRLIAEHPDSPRTAFARANYGPDRRIVEGKKVPAFRVVALEDSTQTISDQNLRGRVYLMDFWAVWCGPCVAKMKDLHDAYDAYREKGFTILSLSFDRELAQVWTFRKSKWPMPWLHTYVEGGTRSELARTFEIIGIPKPVLVGPDGTILAVGNDLRGDGLAKTLARVLNGR
jgi:thiol-disulfide isomerase/thioredoxin